jgi:hypothetical protein
MSTIPYRSWDHLKFSIAGYKHVDPKEIQQSAAEDWRGITVDGSKQ